MNSSNLKDSSKELKKKLNLALLLLKPKNVGNNSSKRRKWKKPSKSKKLLMEQNKLRKPKDLTKNPQI